MISLDPSPLHPLRPLDPVEPGPVRLHETFEEQADRTPEAPALVSEDGSLTYRELEARANRLAHHLISLGVGPEVRVGVFLGRSTETVVSILAVLKAGGAYVPLDPAYPVERVAFMLEDSRAAGVLTDESRRSALPPVPGWTVSLDAEAEAFASQPASRPRADVPPDGLAYLIYTSGSTGRPKGVMIRHRSAAGLVAWARQVFTREELDGVLAATSFCFDLSVFELFVPLSRGGTVILARDALALPEVARLRPVTLVNTVPSAMAELLRAGAVPASVRTVNLAGEALPGALVDGLYGLYGAGVERVFNLYGPSEDTTYSTWALVPPGSAHPPIGVPVANTRARVLVAASGSESVTDPRLVEAGEEGDLHLGGEGLARGYHDRPDLTAERFVPDPWSETPGERLYRTGDLVRELPDGTLLYLGRIDQQVKIRGFRIELGEVEAALARHPAVREAAVAALEGAPGERRLVGFLVPEPGAALPTVRDLRRFLRDTLPEPMVPPAFLAVAALPRTVNGKLDRKVLATLQGEGLDAGTAPGTPGTAATATGERLASLWRDLLGLDAPVGPDDDFFDLGGHSLLATRLVSRLREVFGAELSTAEILGHPTVAALAARIDALAGEGAGVPPVVPVPRGGDLPLSLAQQQFFFLDRLAPGHPVYDLPAAWRLTGELDEAALERAFGEVLRRHEALRTTFGLAGGMPVQRVQPAAPFILPRIDLRALPGARRDQELGRLLRQEAAWRFDLLGLRLPRGPLLRALLIRLDGKSRVLPVNVHHIAADGWSLSLLAAELRELYGAFRQGGVSPLPEPAAQYADYAVWQWRWLTGDRLAPHLAYWKEKLAGITPLDLPADHPRPAVQTFRGRTLPLAVPAGLREGIARLARQAGATPFMALLAGFQALIHRLSGGEDVVVGAPMAQRGRREVEDLIGLFINILVLRSNLAGGPSFRDLLAQVRATALEAYAHQELPAERLVEELHPDRDLSRNPLFQCVFQLLDDAEPLALAGVDAAPLPVDNGTSQFDLGLTLTGGGEEAGGWSGRLESSSDLFDETTVRRWAALYVRLLEAAVAAPDLRLADLPLLGEAERHQVLVEWNDSAREAETLTVPARLAEWAAATPDAVAVRFGDESLTYGELARRARGLAARLRAAGSAGPETLVGLALERSTALVIGLLGIWEAGAAYLPLDPTHPAERLALLLEDAGAPRVVTGEAVRERLALPRERALLLEEDGAVSEDGGAHGAPRASHLAYILYTSGSTGRPKGVRVEHGSLARILAACRDEFGFHAGDVMAVLAPYSFDIFLFELLSPLLAGGTAVLVPARPALDIGQVVSLLPGLTRLHAVPSLMRQIVAAARPLPEADRRPATLFVGGDAVPPDLLAEMRQVFPAAAVRVLYGPTEATILASSQRVHDVASLPRAPLGRPLPNVELRVADGAGRPLPIGVPGEIWIGGAGVSRGYLGQDALTAERFPEVDGRRFYRTGDLGRWLAGGTLEFLGRADAQVKVRGVRVEPGEIEAVLAEHPAVGEAAVLPHAEPGGDHFLVAYVEAQGEADAAGLRAFLQGRLPSAMIPSAFVVLPALPLTPTGKVDRRALAALPVSLEPAGPVAFATLTQEVLAAVWADLLGTDRVVDQVTPGASFFDLGGHSLLAYRLLSRVRESFGVELPVRTLFESPTLAGFAARVDQTLRAGSDRDLPAITRIPREGDLPLSFSQQQFLFLDRLEPGHPVYDIPVAWRLTGELDEAALERAFGEVLRRHEALRAVFGLDGLGEGIPVQRVLPAAPFSLPRIDLRGLPGARIGPELDRLLRQEAAWRFDLFGLAGLRGGPLLRAHLFRVDGESRVLLVNVHHIAADGWSLSILLTRELRELYDAFRQGLPRLPTSLPELAVQYVDFAAWQRRWVTRDVLAPHLAYWTRKLAGVRHFDLPADRPRPAVPTYRGRTLALAVPARLREEVTRLARREGATPFMVLLAGFQALLHRTSGRDDMVVGVPMAQRGRREIEDLIGPFLNTLVLRSSLAAGPSFRELLAQARTTALEAYAHQDLPAERLVEELHPVRDLSRNPLFQCMFQLVDGTEPLALAGVEAEPLLVDNGTAQFDLGLTLTGDGDGWTGLFETSSDLFDETTVRRWAARYLRLLEAAVAAPEGRVADLPLLDEAERHQVLEEWSDREGNRGLRVLDAAGRPLPIGVPGEVWEGDVRTGEQGRWLAGGTLERLGRAGTPAEPEVSAAGPLAAPVPAAPATLTQEVLAGVWSDLLDVGAGRVTPASSFFDLGGHSLLAYRLLSRVRDRFGVELPIRTLFESPELAGFAARIEQALRAGAGQGLPPVTPVPQEARDGDLPLSFSQQRLLFLDRLMPGNPVYNLPLSFRISGPLAVPALEQALSEIVRRHEVLRTSFGLEDEKAFQRVAPPAPLPLPRVDLRGLPRSVHEAELLRRSDAEARQPFDLLRGPVLRALLIQLAEQDHALLLNLHHIATDAWSLEVMLRELSVLYGACARGLPSPLPELPVQYADYAVWQRRWLAGEALEAEARWWRERLAGAPMVLELPADRPRPAVQTHRGVTLSIPLPPGLDAALTRLGRGAGATLFMTLLAGFQGLLARLSGQDDVLVAVPTANRGRREIEGLIGFFINTLVLRAGVDDDPGFGTLLARVREAALGAYAHQYLPFERLVEELQPERDTSRNPIAQVMFQLLTDTDTLLYLDGAEARALPRDSGAARMDLELAVVQADGWLVAFAEYATDLFDATTILRLVEQYGCLLEAVVEEPGRRLSEISLLGEGEEHQILREWNDTARPAAPGAEGARLLHEVFEAQAARTPAAVALTAGGRSMTYGDLEAAANRLARHLQDRGVGPEARVGIFLDRSVDLVVAVLAVLKAGGAYLPLDPAYPRERLAFMLADAATAGAVTREDLAGSLPPLPWTVLLDRGAEALASLDATRPPCAAEPESLAYVIYTSGSTGRPKGVAIRHRAAAEMVAWAGEVFSPAMTAATLASTSICFDLSVFELFLPLSQGGRVVLVRDALALPESGEGVTLVNTVPSAMTGLVQAGAVPASVTTVGLAGEPLPGALVDDFHRLPGDLPGGATRRVYNLYGPSEDTTYSTWALVPPGTRLPPIGRPVSNTRAYVVDRRFQPVPLGVAGELCLGGEGLARGYLGRPELTAERFVPDPWSSEPGGRLYRTGDLVRTLPDGNLRLLGRLDHQVKVRGFRIELGEVEAALLGHPAVREAVVVVRSDGSDRSVGSPADRRLVAYVAGDVAADELRERLRRTLPEYMVPSAFVVLPELPHTPNGKVDRKALPAPDPESRPAGGEPKAPVEPRTPTEAGLAKIWKKVLGVDRLGVQDSFFDVGGHSLLALHVVTRIRGQFGLDLPLAAMFRAPTIEAMAALIDGQAPASTSPVILMGGAGIPKTPFFCVHGVGGNVFRLRELSQLVGRPFYGLQGWSDLKDISYLGSVDAMVSRYLEEIRKAQPAGPYFLGGICVGCHIAFEMARRLQAEGETVAHVVFLDTQAGGQAEGDLDFASLEAAVADELGIPIARQKLLALPPEARLEYLVREGRRSQALPPGFTTADARRYIEVFRLNLSAWNQHRPTPGDVRATLFAGEGLEGDPSAGWSVYALGGCGFIDVTGDHATMLRSPHVQGLAEKLARLLDAEDERLRISAG